MVALLALVFLTQAPNLTIDKRLDKAVSYVTGGEPLSRALAGISKSAGITLSVAHPFGEDIVGLRLSRSNLRDTMQKLATTLKLEWRATDKGYTLYQTTARAKQASQELEFERIGRLRALREEHLARFKLPRPDFDKIERQVAAEEAEPLPDPNKDWKTYEARAKELIRLRNEGSHSLWLASAVLASLTDAQMRELLDNGSITFSAKPNRLQHPMPKQAQPDIDNWANRKGLLSAAGYVRLRMVHGKQIKATIRIDSEGRAVDSMEHFIDLNESTLPTNDRTPKGTRLDEKLEIEGYLGGRWGMQNSRQPSETVMAHMLEAYFTPEKREPLSALAGNGLVEIAEETGNQLVALLSDDMIAFGSQTALPTNGRQLLAQFCDDVRATYTETDGWLTVAPREIAFSRAKQFPRKYFDQIAAAAKKGLLPLSAIARIVGECTDMQFDGRFFRDYLTLKTGRQEFMLLETWGDLSALRLWDSLGEGERRSLSEGAVRIGALDTKSRNLLWRAVSLGGTTGRGESAFRQTYRNPVNQDPTRTYPNGFPLDEVLEVYTAEDDCILSSFGPEGVPAMWVSLSVARFAGYAEPNKADLEKVRLGKSFIISLVMDKLIWHADFRDDIYDFSKPMARWSDAPEALRKRYEEAKKNPPNGYIIR